MMEADLLYLEAFEIDEKHLGPDHPRLATFLNNRANILEKQVTRTFRCTSMFMGCDEPRSNLSVSFERSC